MSTNGTKISALNEVLSVSNDDYVIVNQNGTTKKVKVQAIKGADNLTSDYVELTATNGGKYRLKVNEDGEMICYPSEVDTAKEATEGENIYYDGLIINQIYGGGNAIVETPVSHSFIELYNMREESVNLKGLYLWYRAKTGSWRSLQLKGVVPPKHSFLIRCGKHNDLNAECVRLPIKKYDMTWDIKLANTGFSVYLCIGSETPEDNPVRSRVDINGNTTYTNGRYIDLIGGGGKESDQTIIAYETYYWHCMDKDTALRRCDYANSGKHNIGTNKKNKGNNQGDCEAINYKTSVVSYYRPRSLADGHWGVYDSKPRLKANYPNCINIMYGEDGNTSRTFTYQTSITDEGYLKYRKHGTREWKVVETSKEVIQHLDGEYTLHRVIIHDLEETTYEYKLGYDGCWSEEETFEVKTHSDNSPINFLWTTDAQSWSLEEYKAYVVSMQNILEWEDFEFRLETGDVSQNANRVFEWNEYYRSSGRATKNMCTALTCGNNDLIEKKYSDAFNYYMTAENQVWNSVHAWDLGFTHFVCLNSNTDSTYVDGVGSIGGFANTDAFLQAQCDWLDQHLEEVNRRPVKPRWTIIYVHLAPFTVSRAKRLQRFVPIFEKYKIPLILCGHNHTYARTKALYTGYNGTDAYNDYQDTSGNFLSLEQVEARGADESNINKEEDLANGTHYIMMNATGFKLSGRERLVTLPHGLAGVEGHDNGSGQPWWYKPEVCVTTTQPTYGMIEIGYDAINVKIYTVQNVLVTDANKNITINSHGSQSRRLHDELTINYSDRN